MKFYLSFLLLCVLFGAYSQAYAEPETEKKASKVEADAGHSEEASGKKKRFYSLTYNVYFSLEDATATVKISIGNSKLVTSFDFNLSKHELTNVEGSGEIVRENDRLIWTPPKTKAYLKYTISIPRQRDRDSFDAMMQRSWALFRGDDLVPPARTRFVAGAEARSKIRFHLPEGWKSINTGWTRISNESKKKVVEFSIRNEETNFDRPTGWVIAGDIGTRREKLGDTWVSVSAPVGQELRRMDILTLLQVVWPELERSFLRLPSKILLVGAGDPFWRGGLSAPNSLFLHSDRPMVSENGTSTLIHEIVHVVSGIQGERYQDWIAEGLAEYYSVEILYRSGGISESRKQKILEELRSWSQDVERVNLKNSTGPVTAKAALFFFSLDEELKKVSKKEMSLDNLTRILMKKDKVDFDDIKSAFVLLTGKKSVVVENWSQYIVEK